uniref:Uncharacterized protein n=1 Tax=Cacopsylla melanoneura TaxID=428564 RepID=A0A8D8XG18_9HEMI
MSPRINSNGWAWSDRYGSGWRRFGLLSVDRISLWIGHPVESLDNLLAGTRIADHCTEGLNPQCHPVQCSLHLPFFAQVVDDIFKNYFHFVTLHMLKLDQYTFRHLKSSRVCDGHVVEFNAVFDKFVVFCIGKEVIHHCQAMQHVLC